MTLIKSISGIRGTIGAQAGEGLNPPDVVKFITAYSDWMIARNEGQRCKIVLGRDARVSGPMIERLVIGTLQSKGVDVINLGLSTTPSVEVAVPAHDAQGGIILTASHNPAQWNALKLLNERGEFISGEDGKQLLEAAEKGDSTYVSYDKLGVVSDHEGGFIQEHIQMVLDLPLVDVEAIKQRKFKIAVDAVNSSGGIAIPALLRALGVEEIFELYCTPDGRFPHNPEPLPEHLTEISSVVNKKGADLGIVVDPDVDRLAFVSEDGSLFGEEYTLVAVADYILSQTPGATVSNLSSTRALRDVSNKYGQTYSASAVGEVNVVEKMKETEAVIGGEGNGGIIYPEIHYGRDALVGVALFLTYLAKRGGTVSDLRASYPNYIISKNKIELTPEIDVDKILTRIQEQYKNFEVNTIDGVKIDFDSGWVHLRKSNTEPIIRIYSESDSQQTANHLANKIIDDIRSILKD